MNRRRAIQQAHERAQVKAFITWLNSRYGARYEVVAEPNPPEAIIRSGRTTRWVEVTGAFWSDAFAQDEYSYATLSEKHKPIGNGPFVDPDAQFAARGSSTPCGKSLKKRHIFRACRLTDQATLSFPSCTRFSTHTRSGT